MGWRSLSTGGLDLGKDLIMQISMGVRRSLNTDGDLIMMRGTGVRRSTDGQMLDLVKEMRTLPSVIRRISTGVRRTDGQMLDLNSTWRLLMSITLMTVGALAWEQVLDEFTRTRDRNSTGCTSGEGCDKKDE